MNETSIKCCLLNKNCIIQEEEDFFRISFYSVPVGVGRGCRGVGGNLSIWIFASGRWLQLPLSFLTIHVFASLVGEGIGTRFQDI